MLRLRRTAVTLRRRSSGPDVMGRLRDLTWRSYPCLWRRVVRAALLLTTGIGLITLINSARQYTRPPSAAVVNTESSVSSEEISRLLHYPWRRGAEMLAAVYTYLEDPEHCCRDLRLAGGSTHHEDGSKLVCEDPYLAPTADSCLVYSFGVANDWSFDQAMVERGCEVHSFDPSITRTEGRTEYGAIFHQQGLSGDVNETFNARGWRLATLGTTMKQLGHAGRVLDYLKVDVEANEWDWLDAEDDNVLRRVRQLAMEVHFFNLQVYHAAEQMAEAVEWYFYAFRVLHDAGFCLVSVRENPINPGRSLLPGMREKKATLFEVLWVQR